MDQRQLPRAWDEAPGWDRALYAFLAEKERRSSSRRTVEGYARMLRHFFGKAGVAPDRITSQDVFAWAYGTGLSGKPPSSVTIGARLGCVSCFYRFLIRMGAVEANPARLTIRAAARPTPGRSSASQQVRALLSVLPDTPVGKRDRAIILTLVLTGRRRAEVLSMNAGDLPHDDGRVWYRYRGKGGKTGRRELPQPAYDALTAALVAFGASLDALPAKASLWPARMSDERGITSGTFYGNLQRYFRLAGIPPAGVHIFRHTAAKLRRDVGESIEDVSAFLELARGNDGVPAAAGRSGGPSMGVRGNGDLVRLPCTEPAARADELHRYRDKHGPSNSVPAQVRGGHEFKRKVERRGTSYITPSSGLTTTRPRDAA